MPIPADILAVERPKNTFVICYGKNKDRYAVRKREGCRYDHGRRVPINGKTIGHIIDHKFVPIDEAPKAPVTTAPVTLKDWGNVVLCDQLCHDLLEELEKVYTRSDAEKLYCAAVLRVAYPGIKDYELQTAYQDSFLSERYPDVALSKNTVSSFWGNLGRSYAMIRSYMKIRAAAVMKTDHVLIDGTLKSDESEVNSLSDYSRKARTKGTRDISVLYAFDLEKKEPICSECFPGNMLDATSYEAFIKNNHIKHGIMVGDKGFPSSSIETILNSESDLHYLNPLKRDSRYIEDYDLFHYEGQLKGHETVLFKRVYVEKKKKWLYSYCDIAQAHKEDFGWLHSTSKSGDYSQEAYEEDRKKFGTLLLESDLEMDAETAYQAYACRWEIELVMRYYKQACELDETRVHSDYSVIGSEFCSFLSSVITYRLLNRFEKEELFDNLTYKKIIHVLTRAKKVKADDSEWQLIKMNPSQIEILQKLDLLEKPAPKKRGRKPKKQTV